MGYSDAELADLAATINAAPADVVVAGTPTDLVHLMRLNKPVIRARYDFKEAGEPRLGDLVLNFLKQRGLLKRTAVA
jgi:predicted GTPase